MKIPNREINIFNMSMLDVICGALGAFLIVTVVLFPSYRNRATVIAERIRDAEEANRRLREELEMATKAFAGARDVQALLDENRKLEEELERLGNSEARTGPPLLAWIVWQQTGGSSWYYDTQVTISLTPENGRDMRNGMPHSAVGRNFAEWGDKGWQYVFVKSTSSSSYAVSYQVARRPSRRLEKSGPEPEYNPVSVSGYVAFRKQEVELPEVTLHGKDDTIVLGRILLGANGKLSFRKEKT